MRNNSKSISLITRVQPGANLLSNYSKNKSKRMVWGDFYFVQASKCELIVTSGVLQRIILTNLIEMIWTSSQQEKLELFSGVKKKEEKGNRIYRLLGSFRQSTCLRDLSQQ